MRQKPVRAEIPSWKATSGEEHPKIYVGRERGSKDKDICAWSTDCAINFKVRFRVESLGVRERRKRIPV